MGFKLLVLLVLCWCACGVIPCVSGSAKCSRWTGPPSLASWYESAKAPVVWGRDLAATCSLATATAASKCGTWLLLWTLLTKERRGGKRVRTQQRSLIQYRQSGIRTSSKSRFIKSDGICTFSLCSYSSQMSVDPQRRSCCSCWTSATWAPPAVLHQTLARLPPCCNTHVCESPVQG